MSTHQKKRKLNADACFLCQKENLSCNGTRPCNRCSARGVPQMCFGLELDRQAEHHQTVNPTPEPRPASAAASPGYHTTSNPGYHGAAATGTAAGQLQSIVPISPEQSNLNSYFINELRKIKADQQKLEREVANLKIVNATLHDSLRTSQWQVQQLLEYFRQIQQQLLPANGTRVGGRVLPAAAGENGELVDTSQAMVAQPQPGEQPMVVFDLRTKTPFVLTANEAFCRLLGYSMNEVVGMPWRKFIPPDSIQRTMAILGQKDLNSVIQMEQIYRHRNDDLLRTVDTHMFLFGSDGSPLSDIVSIALVSRAPANAAAPAQPPPPLPYSTGPIYLPWHPHLDVPVSTTSQTPHITPIVSTPSPPSSPPATPSYPSAAAATTTPTTAAAAAAAPTVPSPSYPPPSSPSYYFTDEDPAGIQRVPSPSPPLERSPSETKARSPGETMDLDADIFNLENLHISVPSTPPSAAVPQAVPTTAVSAPDLEQFDLNELEQYLRQPHEF